MKKEERRRRLALTVLVSLFVFIIIAVAGFLAGLLVYVMIRLGIIKTVGGRPEAGTMFLLLPITSTLIGVLFTLLTGRISLRPFYQLINQLNRLASGDFHTRIHFSRPISRHFVFREIEKSFNSAAEELEHTEMLRGDFINNFSHEFKTPIVSIAGFAKLLRRGNLSEAQKEEYLAVIEEEALRLSEMATNMLNLTKVENQTILTNVTSYNLSEQIRSTVLLLAEKWKAKDLEPDLDFQEYTIEANEELLKQIWVNLIDNAVKFSEPGNLISFHITEKADDLFVSVSNRGTEIPEESLNRIFNKFYQADESHSSEGNGIGLAIVKKVVELHSGEISVRSENGRTTFTVRLPKQQSEP